MGDARMSRMVGLVEQLIDELTIEELRDVARVQLRGYTEAIEKVGELSGQLETMNKEAQAWFDRNKALKKQVAELEGQYQAWGDSNRKLRDRNAELEAELERYEGQNAKLVDDYGAALGDVMKHALRSARLATEVLEHMKAR